MRIAVLGAGPIGLEAAVAAEDRGHEVVVLEAEGVAHHVAKWGHVRLFTPWRMAMTEAGAARAALHVDSPDPDAFPTGAALRQLYLLPIAATLDVRTGHRVVTVGRQRRQKADAIGSFTRAQDPFRLLVRTVKGEQVFHADAVLDCTGVFSDPGPVGPGGAPAVGEAALNASGRLRHGPVPVDDLSDARVLLVGDGASAVTVLSDLLDRPGVTVCWVTASEAGPGFVSPDNDPLPARSALAALGRAAPADARVDHRPTVQIEAFHTTSDGVIATFSDGTSVEADCVIGCTGFRPDHTLSRELQVHLCYATEGTMKLAAALLAASGGGGDCLTQEPVGSATLASPEPRFFVLGNKSYGRRSDFLLQIGHAQVQGVLDLLQTG